MERTHIYFTLAGALAKRGISPAGIENYGQLWDSITRLIACRARCVSYTRASDLRSSRFPEKAGKEPMRCEVFVAVFYSLLPA